MDIRALHAFLQLAQVKSFSKASALLGVAQPALSRQIGRLEEELGQKLFHRDGRGISLTGAGRTFVPHAKSMVEALQSARSEIANLEGEPRGTVTLGLSPTMHLRLVPGLVRQLRSRYPRITLRVMQALSGELNEWLVQGRVDAAVIAQTPATRQRQGHVLWTEDLYLIGPGSERTARDCALTELATLDLVLPTAGHGLRTAVEESAHQNGINLRMVLEIDSLTMLVWAAQEGVGYAVLPKYVVAKELKARTVSARKIVDPPIRRTMMLATGNPKLLSPAARTVIELITRQPRATRS